MGVVQMQKVAVLTLLKEREQIINALHEEGVLHIVEHGMGKALDHTEVDFRKAEVDYAIQILSAVASKETMTAMSKPSTAQEITHAAHHTDVLGIVEELRKLEESDTGIQSSLQEVRQLQNDLKHWVKIPQAPKSIQCTSQTVKRIIGTLPEENVEELRTELAATMPKSVFETFDTIDGLTGCYVIVWKSEQLAFEELATALGWTSVQLPELDTSISAAYEEAIMEEKRLVQTREENNRKREELAIELPNLTKVAQYMKWLDQKQFAREAMSGTADTVALFGWMPKKDVTLLEDRLQKLSPAITILKVKPDQDEEAPVHISNSKLVTPFQSVTTLYGLPTQDDMDPTAALSPFFAIYFALCLTDAGYGAVLAAIFGGYLLKTRKSVEEATLPWLLFISGVAAFLVGIPFGGWLGLSPEAFPSWLTKETAEGTLFVGQVWNLNAQSGVDFLRNLSMVLGLTHLFFGMFLAGWHKWIHDRKAEAFWQDFTSHIFLFAAIFMALAPESLTSVAKITLYGALILIIWGKGYGSKWYLRPIMGALGFVNFAIGLLSNGLSYLRILALGLVTGAIAMAINQVAVELGKLFPVWLAIPVIVLIFVGGHLVSIALNVLGSFIHSARLQFIEFFSQFFEGGGKAYSPFRRNLQ